MNGSAIGWHPADIRAAVSKRGSSLAKVSVAAGLHKDTAKGALAAPSHAGEQAIAKFLGVPAHQIWPGRYDSEGVPRHPRIRKQLNAPERVRERQNGAA